MISIFCYRHFLKISLFTQLYCLKWRLILKWLLLNWPQDRRPKNFFRSWLLILDLKECLVECATVCFKSEVILIFTFLPANKLQSSVNWLFRQILFSLSSFRCTYLSLFQLWGVGQELRVSTSRSPCVTLSKMCNRLEIRNWS